MSRLERYVHWILTLAVLVVGPGLYSIATAQPFSTPYAVAYCRLSGCTITGEMQLNEGFRASGDYDPVCSAGASAQFDVDGAQSCNPITDVAAVNLRMLAQSASPLGTGANQVGASLSLRPGSGTHAAVMASASWVNNTTTFTVTVDGTALTNTEGSNGMECNGSNQACADNVANYYEGLAAAAGIHACSLGSTTPCTTFGFTAAAATTYFFPAPEDSPGKYIDSIACSTGAAATLTNGTGGRIQIVDGTAALPAVTFLSDTDTGIAHTAANTVVIATNGTAKLTIDTSTMATGLNATVGGTLAVAGAVRDVAASCVQGEVMIDTGGATVEICVCTATNTIRCAPTVTTNPAD